MGVFEDWLAQQQQGQTLPPGLQAAPGQGAPPGGFDPALLAQHLGLPGPDQQPEGPAPEQIMEIPQQPDAMPPAPPQAITPDQLVQPHAIPSRNGQYDTAPEAVAAANADARLGQAKQGEANSKAMQMAQANQVMQQGIEDQRAAFEANAQARAKRLADIQAESNTLRAKVEAYGNEKSDPMRIFNTMSAPGRIVLGLQMGITGFLNPQNPQAVMSVMNNLISADMASQDSDRKAKGHSLEMLIGMNKSDEGRAEDLFKSDELLRATRWSFVKSQAEQIGAQQTDATAKARSKVIAAEADKQMNDALLKAAEANVKLKAEMSRASVPISVAKIQGQNQMSLEKVKAQVETNLANTKLANEDVNKALDREGKKTGVIEGVPKGFQAVYDPGTGESLGNVPQTIFKDVENFKTQSDNASQIMNRIMGNEQKMTEWQKRPDLANFGSNEIHEMQADYAELRKVLKNMDGMGANFTALENEIEQQRIGKGPDTWTTYNNHAKLAHTFESLQEQIDRYATGKKLKSWSVAEGGAAGGSQATPAAGNDVGFEKD